MTDKQEKQLDDIIKKQMQKVKDAGMLTGIKTISSIILEKAKDVNKTDRERINDIISYCEWTLGTIEKK